MNDAANVDAVPSETTTVPAQASMIGAQTSRSVPAPPSKRRAVTTPDPDDPLVREMVLIEAAGRALDRRAYGKALANLQAHAAQFPRGMLAVDRERIRRTVVAAMRHEPAKTSP